MAGSIHGSGVLRHTWRWLRARPLGALSIGLIAALVVLALLAPVLTPYVPLAQDASAQAKSPSAAHPLGTDYLGRDVLSRVIIGVRPSLGVGLVSVAIALVAGSTLGLVSGYLGGTVDLVLQRVVDVLLTLPGLVLALALLAIVGTGFASLIGVIAVVLSPGIARVVRSATLVVTAAGYIESARAIGAGDARIVVRHVLPNTLATILVLASLNLGNAILFEAALSFLGLGVQPPQPSWGNMLSGPARAYFEVAPWMAVFPGIAVSLSVLGFNLLGDTLRDAFDPRLRSVT
jgi:peptide/nickel transport system permease protein